MHLIRNSIKFASWKDHKALAAALKPIYQAVTTDAAATAIVLQMPYAEFLNNDLSTQNF